MVARQLSALCFLQLVGKSFPRSGALRLWRGEMARAIGLRPHSERSKMGNILDGIDVAHR
jgi:hypothetical protein